MTTTPRTALDVLIQTLAAKHHPRFVPVEEIVDAVCHMHRLPISEVLDKGRTHVLTHCRHDLVIAIKTLRPFMDLVTIAKSAGYKGHAQAVVILQNHFGSPAQPVVDAPLRADATE